MWRYSNCASQLETLIALESEVGVAKIVSLISIPVLQAVSLCSLRKALNANILIDALGWCGRRTHSSVS